jgi:hypothetical protein
MRRALWTVLLGALIVLPNLFAFVQLRATGGYLFYANAFDEPTYLSYDGAMLTRSVTHLAEYVVVAFHRLGVSGGYTNLLLDIACPIAMVLLMRRIGFELGFSAAESTVYPFFVLSFPVLFGYANPYYTVWYNRNYYSAGLSWITLPQGYYPPFFRTPEPELSWCVAALATWAALRWRSFLPALAIVPFIYPFVGLPFAFVVVGLAVHRHLEDRIASRGVRVAVSILAAYACIAGVVFAFYTLFVAGTTLADFLPPTRLPLLSGSGVAAIVVYMLVRRRLDGALRTPALLLAIAPLAAANTQILSGFLQTPHNLEQNFGVVALSIICVLALRAIGYPRVVAPVVALASCLMLALYSSYIFAVNSSIWQRTPPPLALIDSLKHEPESLVIGNPDLADMFSLIAPRIGFSAMARSQTLRSDPDRGEGATSGRFENYQCVKRLLAHSDAAREVPTAAFQTLDRGFRFLNQDFPLIHLNRRTDFTQYFDPSGEPHACRSRSLKMFPALMLEKPVAEPHLLDHLRNAMHSAEGDAPIVVTPEAQWAYAVMDRLPAAALLGVTPPRLVDFRARVTVTRGCVAVGILSPDQQMFVSDASLTSAAGPQQTDLVFEPGAKGHWLVIHNCSAKGPSAGVVLAADLFPVAEVTVRPVSVAR